MPGLVVKNLHFHYGGKPVLKGLDFTLAAGFTGILGANGSGKTTLLKNISGYLKPLTGQIILQGRDIKELSSKEKSRLIGYVPQDTALDIPFPCYDIVMMGRIPHLGRFQREGAGDRAAVQQAMEWTHTWDFKDRFINELSGGERQRVYIARALAQNPKVLLMDEPISHLDIRHQAEILSLLKSLRNEGILVLAALHDINLAAQFCDHILLLQAGELLAQGKPQEVSQPDLIKEAFGVDTSLIENPSSSRHYLVLKESSYF